MYIHIYIYIYVIYTIYIEKIYIHTRVYRINTADTPYHVLKPGIINLEYIASTVGELY